MATKKSGRSMFSNMATPLNVQKISPKNNPGSDVTYPPRGSVRDPLGLMPARSGRKSGK